MAGISVDDEMNRMERRICWPPASRGPAAADRTQCQLPDPPLPRHADRHACTDQRQPPDAAPGVAARPALAGCAGGRTFASCATQPLPQRCETVAHPLATDGLRGLTQSPGRGHQHLGGRCRNPGGRRPAGRRTGAPDHSRPAPWLGAALGRGLRDAAFDRHRLPECPDAALRPLVRPPPAVRLRCATAARSARQSRGRG